jgi:hypothetical protein
VVRTTVNAEAVCAQQVSATIQTRMEAISALLLEVVDTNDPVQVGREVNYVITVKNQGDKLDRNIRLVVTLPEEEEFASAPGQFQPQQMNAGQPNKADNAPANADAGVPPAQGGKQILFVIPELGPKQTATVNLNCKALRPGDVRFRVDMTSENLTKPVMETESTKLF